MALWLGWRVLLLTMSKGAQQPGKFSIVNELLPKWESSDLYLSEAFIVNKGRFILSQLFILELYIANFLLPTNFQLPNPTVWIGPKWTSDNCANQNVSHRPVIWTILFHFWDYVRCLTILILKESLILFLAHELRCLCKLTFMILIVN
jgi:hypothetical protein